MLTNDGRVIIEEETMELINRFKKITDNYVGFHLSPLFIYKVVERDMNNGSRVEELDMLGDKKDYVVPIIRCIIARLTLEEFSKVLLGYYVIANREELLSLALKKSEAEISLKIHQSNQSSVEKTEFNKGYLQGLFDSKRVITSHKKIYKETKTDLHVIGDSVV